jgi:hypothetical protein
VSKHETVEHWPIGGNGPVRAKGAVEVPLSDLTKGLTLQLVLTGVWRMRFRLWLGTKLLRLAAAVIGCKVEVEVKP